MNHLNLKNLLILMVGMTVVLPRTALAQTDPRLLASWGTASNGICAGIYFRDTRESGLLSTRPNDVECEVYVRNMSTNLLWFWVPHNESYCEVELRDPDGHRVRQVKPMVRDSVTSWGAMDSVSSTNRAWSQLDWYFLKERFDIQTNGLHTLVVSVRFNAFTNFSQGHIRDG